MYNYNVKIKEQISNTTFVVQITAPSWSIAKSVVLNQYPMHIFISIKANLRLVASNNRKKEVA